MTLEEATDKVLNHPELKYLIFGVVPNDGEFRLDAAACVSEKDLENEKKKFLTVRIWELKEVL